MSDELTNVTRIGPAIPVLTDVVPVRIVECEICHGTGSVELRLNSDGMSVMTTCAYCAGRGRIATDGEA